MAATHTENDKPKAAAKDDKPVVVKSEAGETHPTVVFGGDGITPLAEWEERYKEAKEAQAKRDEERRERAREDAGVIQTTEKHRHAAILAAEERRHASAEKQEQADQKAQKHNG